MNKIRPIKNSWYDWFINYIPEPIRKGEGGFKDKIVFLRQTHLKNCVWERKETKQTKKTKQKKSFVSAENQKKLKIEKLEIFVTLFATKEGKKEREKLEKKSMKD